MPNITLESAQLPRYLIFFFSCIYLVLPCALPLCIPPVSQFAHSNPELCTLQPRRLNSKGITGSVTASPMSYKTYPCIIKSVGQQYAEFRVTPLPPSMLLGRRISTIMPTRAQTKAAADEAAIKEDPRYDLNRFPHTFPVFDTTIMEPMHTFACFNKNTPGNKWRIKTKYVYYKPFKPCNYERMLATIEKFEKIKKLGNRNQLQMVKLYGVVNGGYDSKGEYLEKGLVYHWITLKDGWKGIGDMLVHDNPSVEHRNMWMIQLQRTVAELHRIGVIWGDARADCVMIDRYNNAIILDLEGGFTPSWIDQDLEGTMQGDMLALARLMDFIYNDKCPRRVQLLEDARAGKRN